MKVYSVWDSEREVFDEYFSLREAKKEIRRRGTYGYITKVYADGEWVPCGEISMTGNNKTFVANTRQTVRGY